MITGLTGVNVLAWPDAATTQKDIYYQWIRDWNLNCVTINFGWNHLEPVKGQYSLDFLSTLDTLVQRAKSHGLRTLLRFSKFNNPAGYQGDWPDWPAKFTQAFPRWLGTTGLPPGTTAAPFWEDYNGCQQRYIEMFRMLARRYAYEPYMLGFCLMSEPGGDIGIYYGDADWYSWNCNGCRKTMSVLFDPERLYKRTIDAIHLEAPDKIVQFEGHSGNIFRYSALPTDTTQTKTAEKPDCPNIVAAMTHYPWFIWDWFNSQVNFVKNTWGIPFAVTEFAPVCANGALNPTEAEKAWLDTACKTYNSKDVSWSYWALGRTNLGDRYGLIQGYEDLISPLADILKAYGIPTPIPLLALIASTAGGAVGGVVGYVLKPDALTALIGVGLGAAAGYGLGSYLAGGI